MRNLNQDTITQAVIERFSSTPDPRLKEILISLIQHLHAFAREVKLTEEEWFKGIDFLTRTGHMCDDKRQEFILLSDTLGVSMLVVALEHARALKGRTGATPPTDATVQGPFYWVGAPDIPLGGDIGEGVAGEPALYNGRVTDLEGKPLAGALLDVWSGDGEGVYDMQRENSGMKARGRIRTDHEGRYWFWSIRPTYYPVPDDGPVGDMLRKMGRHPNRPGHIHMKVSASKHVPLTTHLFVSDSPYIDSDAVFGVRPSLIVEYESHPAGQAPDGRTMGQPYWSAHYDFRLEPQAA